MRFLGLGFLEPLIRLFSGEEPARNGKLFAKKALLPLFSIILFIGLWHIGATALYNSEAAVRIEKAREEQGEAAATAMKECITSGDVSCQPNTLPSPTKVYQAYLALWQDHLAIAQKKSDFKARVSATNAQREAQGLAPITYTGRPSFLDQVGTSLKTVAAGCLLAMLVAVPIGIIMGLSNSLRTSFNWLIQIFKPVSPVVWLLLVFMIVKTVITDPSMDKSFIISFISVGLCAMGHPGQYQYGGSHCRQGLYQRSPGTQAQHRSKHLQNHPACLASFDFHGVAHHCISGLDGPHRHRAAGTESGARVFRLGGVSEWRQ